MLGEHRHPVRHRLGHARPASRAGAAEAPVAQVQERPLDGGVAPQGRAGDLVALSTVWTAIATAAVARHADQRTPA